MTDAMSFTIRVLVRSSTFTLPRAVSNRFTSAGHVLHVAVVDRDQLDDQVFELLLRAALLQAEFFLLREHIGPGAMRRTLPTRTKPKTLR